MMGPKFIFKFAEPVDFIKTNDASSLRPQIQERARMLRSQFPETVPTYAAGYADGDFERGEITVVLDMSGQSEGTAVFDSNHELLG